MPKQTRIESRPDDRDLRRLVAGLAEALEDQLRLVRELAAALERTAGARETPESSQAPLIAPGSYTRDTLPALGSRAQALLDSIWDGAGGGAPAPTKVRRGTKSGKPRGRLRLTDRGGLSVIDYLARR